MGQNMDTELVELPAILDIFRQLVITTSTYTGVVGSRGFMQKLKTAPKASSTEAVFSEVHMSQNVAN